MNLQRAFFLGALALVAGACDDDDDVIVAPNEARAGIRYVNAVPDTIALDFRAVDIVENNPFIQTQFREFKQAGYAPVKPGSRHFRVFPNSTNISVTSRILLDDTLDLQANTNYTALHVGFARAGQTPQQQLILRADTIPTPPAGQIAVRVLNVGIGLGSVNVYATTSTTAAIGATPTFSNIAYLGASGYVNIPTTSTLAFRATAVGSPTVLASVAVPVGDPGSARLDPLPGSSIAGSVFTVYLFPRSVAGSTAPQTAAFNTPGLVIVPDAQVRRPSQER